MKKIAFIAFLTVSLCAPGLGGASASEVTGNLNTGISNSNVNGTVITAPSASPAAGAYTSAQSVTLSASGANSIHYTIATDGTTPATPTCTTGTTYSGAISVSSAAATTIKAISCYPNSNASTVASFSYTFSCATASVTNGSVSAYPTCGVSCNSGYTLSGSTCVANAGGGGGASSITYCSSVSYDAWQTACTGGYQYRNILSQTPSGCSLTADQENQRKKTCQLVSTETPSTGTTGTTETSQGTETETETKTETATEVKTAPTGEASLKEMADDASNVSSGDVSKVLSSVDAARDLKTEAEVEKTITLKIVAGSNVAAAVKNAINNFVAYGTDSTKILGAGERGGVVNSFKAAFGKLPSSAAEWNDVMKIANGRWPSSRSEAAEDRAAVNFKRIYLRAPDRSKPSDDAAITVMSYGLRPAKRNLDSEKAAIKSFKAIYGYNPATATAWDVVRAIAYSGAKR